MCRDLRNWTTYGIGGRARSLAMAKDRQSLCELAPHSLVLGFGSNVLVSDEGYDGAVLINRYDETRFDGMYVYAGSGLRLGALSKMLADRGLGGGEWFCGIPGTVGGAIVMNAGAHGNDISAIVRSVDVLADGRVKTLTRDEIPFSYRSSGIVGTVVGATFEFYPRERKLINAETQRFSAWRAEHQPRGRSAGSVFKNPDGAYIAELIDRAGLKGKRIGGAEISQKHANFIVNTGGATARDVKRLIDAVKVELKQRFGIDAKEEIKYIGEFV